MNLKPYNALCKISLFVVLSCAPFMFGYASAVYSSTLAQKAQNKDVVVINDIASWSHPVKDVFAKNGITLTKVELRHNKKYPVFFVKIPWDPQTSPNARLLFRLEFAVLRANGNNSYALQDDDDCLRIEVIWNKEQNVFRDGIVLLDDGNCAGVWKGWR